MKDETQLTPTITAAGIKALFAAHHQGLEAKITHLALGDAGYVIKVNDNGTTTQSTLKGEKERVAIQDGRKSASETISVSAVVESTAQYWVREIAFYLEDGTLFALWSDAETAIAWKSKNVPLLLSFELTLSAVPAESLVVQGSGAPLELLMRDELATIGAAIADLQWQQRKNQDAQEAMAQTQRNLQNAIAQIENGEDLLLPIDPRVESVDGRLEILQDNDDQIRIANGQSWIWRGWKRYTSDQYAEDERRFTVAKDKTYHLRWSPRAGFALRDLSDAVYNPAKHAESDPYLDSDYDDMLIATIDKGNITAWRNTPPPVVLADLITNTRQVMPHNKMAYPMSLNVPNDFAQQLDAEVAWHAWFGRPPSYSYGIPHIEMDGTRLATAVREHWGNSGGYVYTTLYSGVRPINLNRNSHRIRLGFYREHSHSLAFNPGRADASSWREPHSWLTVKTTGGA